MSNRFQNVNFTSLEDCYAHVTPQELEIMLFLRELIVEIIPGCTEKLSYNVPYFYGNSRICYLWPASIPWGNVSMNGVQLGFCDGNLLSDPTGYLEKGKRKQVYYKEFTSIEQFSEGDVELLRNLLIEAVEMDRKKRQTIVRTRI